MKILGFLIKFFNTLYTAVGPDIKNKKAQALKESLSNMYLRWAPRLAADEEFLNNAVAALLTIWLLCLIFVSAILKSLVSKGHIAYIVVASDTAFLFYLLLFGRWTIRQLKDDLLRISKSIFKLFATILLILNVLFFAITCLYTRSVPSFGQTVDINFRAIAVMISLYIGLALVFRLVPFVAFYSSVTVVKRSVRQSLKQESNQLGHFLRYIGWPALGISLLHIILIFF